MLSPPPQAPPTEHQITAHPHSLTVLTHDVLPLTKSYHQDEQGNVTKTPCAFGKHYNARTVCAPDIHTLASILTKLSVSPKSAVIRASLREGVKPRRIQRLIVPTHAPFEHVDRAWVCADSDEITLPFDTDPRDPTALSRAALYLLDKHGLAGVSCVVGWSSSAFLTDLATPSPRQAKAHLWFLLDKPVCTESLKPWIEAKGFDPTMAEPIQLHYTSNPVFTGGVRDPLAWRVKLFLGEADTYNTEGTGLYDTKEAERRAAIAKEAKEQQQRATKNARQYVAPVLLREYDTKQRQNALQAALQKIANAPQNLNNTFYSAANSVGRALGYDVDVLATLVSAACARGSDARKDEDTIKRGYLDGTAKHVDRQADSAPALGWCGAFKNAQATDINGVKMLSTGERVAALCVEGDTVGLVWQRDKATGVYGQREDVKDAAFCVGDTNAAQTVFLCVAFKTALATLQHAPQAAVWGGRYTVASAYHAHNAQRQKQRDERREAKERGEDVPTQKPVARAVVYDASNAWEKAQAHEAALRYTLPLFVLDADGLTQTPVDTALSMARAVAWKEEQERRMLTPFDVVKMETPKLPTITQSEGTLCILSGKGTEKTTRAADYVRTNPATSVLYIAPLMELVENAARQLGLASYDTLRNADRHREQGEASAFCGVKHLAICLPSLWRLFDDNDRLTAFDVVILDEVSQTLRAFESDLVPPEQRVLLWQIWTALIKSARLVLAMDAGLDAPSLALLRELRGATGFEVWHNTYKTGAGCVVRLHDDKASVVQHAQNALAMGESVFFAENVLGKASKGNGTQETAVALSEKNANGVVVCSKTTKERGVRRFLENPAQAPSWVVATPTLSTGFSIPHGTFDNVCAVLSRVGTPSDGTQLVCRVRGAKRLDVALDFRRQALHAPTTEQRATAYAAQDPFLRLVEMRRVHSEPLYQSTFDAIRKADAAARCEWAWGWLVAMVADGWSVEIVNEGNKEQRQAIAKERREVVKKRRTEAIASAKEITTHEAKQLQKRRLTLRDADAIAKRQLRDAYNAHNADQDELRELVERDRDGALRKQIERLELCADITDTQARAREARRMGNGVVMEADLRAVGLERELYRRALWAAGVDPYSLNTDAAYTYTAQSERVSAFVGWCEAWRVPLTGVVALPTTARLRSNPLQFLGGVLRRMGIATKAQGANAARLYSVDAACLEEMRRWVLLRCVVSLSDSLFSPCSTKYDQGVSSSDRTHFCQVLEKQKEPTKTDTLANTFEDTLFFNINTQQSVSDLSPREKTAPSEKTETQETAPSEKTDARQRQETAHKETQGAQERESRQSYQATHQAAPSSGNDPYIEAALYWKPAPRRNAWT